MEQEPAELYMDLSAFLSVSGASTPRIESALSETEPVNLGAVTNIRRKPIPRKGHRKSRRGCKTCKSRKVKCDEIRPGCNHCKRLNLDCEYPNTTTKELGSPSPALQSTPTIFTMEDLRFFQHFLVTAYPPLPLKGDAIWRDVASMAHEYDYLVHAMLGLAASHLGLCSDGDYSTQALSHRVTAISSLNKSLGRPCSSKAEGDARFAAMMALTFQASYMADGVIDFLCMSRGCHIVAMTAMPKFDDSLFRSFSHDGHINTVKAMLETASNDPTHQQDMIDSFLDSLRAIMPLCGSTLELKFLTMTDAILRQARTAPVDAYANMALLYGLLGEVSNEDFAAFTNPGNHVAHMILIHFFLIEHVIGFYALGPVAGRFVARKKMTRIWLERLAANVPQRYHQYLDWPKEFARQVLGAQY